MINRILIPGSEWLYFKIYTGTKSADIILTENISPFVEFLIKNRDIDEWFFIRYEDPKFHLRVRLKISQSGSFDNIMRAFHHMFEPLVHNGLIINLQMDCYKREIERYGEVSIEITENYFFIDSVAITKIITRLRQTGDSDEIRWLLAINLIDDTLNAAGYDIFAKINFIESVDASFRREFNMITSNQTKLLNSKYRDYRKKIEDVMNHKEHYGLYQDILLERERKLKNVFEKIIKCNGNDFASLMPSYTHMTVNRLFRSKNRQYEMVIYYLMNKFYASYVAREKMKINEKISII